jgi:hypothetical protein
MSGARPLLALCGSDVDKDSFIFFHQLSQNLVEKLCHCRKLQLYFMHKTHSSKVTGKGKGKVDPRTGHERPEGE